MEGQREKKVKYKKKKKKSLTNIWDIVKMLTEV